MVGFTYDEFVSGPEPYRVSSRQDPFKRVLTDQGEFSVYLPQTNSPKGFARDWVEYGTILTKVAKEGILNDPTSSLNDLYIVMHWNDEHLAVAGRFMGFDKNGVFVDWVDRTQNIIRLAKEVYGCGYSGRIYVWPSTWVLKEGGQIRISRPLGEVQVDLETRL